MKDTHIPRARAAVVTVIDAHTAIIDHCDDGALTRIRSIFAVEPHGTSDHMGDAPRQTFHSGTRGATAGDAAQRARAAARRRFIGRVAPLVAATAVRGDWIVLGGSRLFTKDLQEALDKLFGQRAIIAPGLHRAMSADAMIACVTTAVSEHLAVRDVADVRSLLERTGAHTTGVVGPVATLDAAERGAVDLVLMSPRYRERHAEDVARLVAATRSHGGRLDTVSDGAASMLDAYAGGVGALLCFAMHRMPAIANP